MGGQGHGLDCRPGDDRLAALVPDPLVRRAPPVLAAADGEELVEPPDPEAILTAGIAAFEIGAFGGRVRRGVRHAGSLVADLYRSAGPKRDTSSAPGLRGPCASSAQRMRRDSLEAEGTS
jgi:hypothetical protein